MNRYNYFIGTQQIGVAYQFTTDPPLVEMAKRTSLLGMNIVKFKHNDPGADIVIDQLNFKYHFIWFRSEGSTFINGMNSTVKQMEYSKTYEYTKSLLTKHNGSDKEFFLGNWEGDWYLIPQMNPKLNADPVRITGMIDWINTRQAAITKARSDFQSTVKVYYYVEMNRVVDAMEKGMSRLVNYVLPMVKVDYISLSSYDFQRTTLEYSMKVIDYIKERFICLDQSVVDKTERIIIGEFSRPLQEFKAMADPDKEYSLANLAITKKYLQLGFKFILYWNFYNNEVNNNQQVGYHLIDYNNTKSLLYYAFSRYYKITRVYLWMYKRYHGTFPSELTFRNFAIKTIDFIK